MVLPQLCFVLCICVYKTMGNNIVFDKYILPFYTSYMALEGE